MGTHRSTAARVSRLTEDDWALFAQLRLQALSDALGVDDNQYRHERRFGETEWRYRIGQHIPFAGWLDDRPVGLIVANRDTEDTVYVYSLWLDPAARGHGLAGQLLAATVDWARNLRAQTLHLRVAANNVAARNVYERFGFTAQEASNGELLMSLTV